MVYAPIMIPTLCRHEHFVRCIESLKKNGYAKYTDVYIALDYPAKDSHWDGYNKILEYLNGDFHEFKSFNVVRREENYGSKRNIEELRDFIFERYDRIIRTDDDIEFSENFLEYIDKCLDYFEMDEDVVAVSGYSYPVEWITHNDANVIRQNFVASMWGTAYWKDKFLIADKCISSGQLADSLKYSILNRRLKNMIDKCKIEYIKEGIIANRNSYIYSFSDISLRMYCAVYDKYIIIPTISKARNHGFDGSGMYCQKINSDYGEFAGNYKYMEQEIDVESAFTVNYCEENELEQNRERLNVFDKCSLKEKILVYICASVYLIVGREFFRRIKTLINRLKHE